MIKKCLFLFLLLFAAGSVIAEPIDYNLEQSDFDSGTVSITSPGTYYLTENITSTNGIQVRSSNVTLDGQGYSLNTATTTAILDIPEVNNILIENFNITTSTYGILVFSENSTISGNTINSWDSGVYCVGDNTVITGNNITSYNTAVDIITSSKNDTISGNTITSTNKYGLRLVGSQNSTISGNTINSYNFGIYVYGTSDWLAINNTISGNTILSRNDGIYIESYSKNNTISGNTITSTSYEGIFLIQTYNNTISGNTINSHNDGIYVGSYSKNNTISGNTINSSYYGVNIYYYADGNTVSENTGNSSRMGIYVGSYSNNNTISGNSICPTGSYHPIHLENNCLDNYILETKFENSTKTIYVASGCRVYVYLNDFINSSAPEIGGNCIFNSPANVSYDYDGTTYSGIAGNYWGDYNESSATIINGIWSIPYRVTLSINDSYPLAEPVTFEIEENDEEPVDDGKIHLTQADFATGLYIINETGIYILEENINSSMGIAIDSNNVTIDGNGFYMNGGGISTFMGSYENITIKNLGINCDMGLNLANADTITVSNCVFLVGDTGIVADGENIVISSCNFTGIDGGWGINIGSMQNGTISGCKFNNLMIGINTQGESAIGNCTITYNEFIENSWGLNINGEYNWIYLNDFESNTWANFNYDSTFTNYFHSPVLTYEYDGVVYEGRLGNYYVGEELGTSVSGIFDRPYGIVPLIPR